MTRFCPQKFAVQWLIWLHLKIDGFTCIDWAYVNNYMQPQKERFILECSLNFPSTQGCVQDFILGVAKGGQEQNEGVATRLVTRGWTTSDFLKSTFLWWKSSRRRLVADDIINEQISLELWQTTCIQLWHMTQHCPHGYCSYNSLFFISSFVFGSLYFSQISARSKSDTDK